MNRSYKNASLAKEGKQLFMEDVVRHQRDEAYKWAKDEQKRLGCMAGNIRVGCDGEDCPELVDHYYDNSQCVVSLFVSSDKNAAPLMMRNWLDEGSLTFNVLVNYEELNTVWPKYTERLLENGIKIYRHFDGPNGGITRYMPDKAFK